MEAPARIPVADGVLLDGDLVVPEGAAGVVLFAHGSGSSRHSSRNQAVARGLRGIGLATLLLDLLTPEEEAEDSWTGHLRFDVGLLAGRLDVAADWLGAQEATAGLPLGLFGASTGGGAALVLAARRPERVRAIVSRGGRPDLAGVALGQVQSPTLLIAGGADEPVLALNRDAAQQIAGPVELAVVPGASHLFEEPGALEQVCGLAANWFRRWLTPEAQTATRTER